jgi:hypothetical protein
MDSIMELETIAQRYMNAVDALHTVHSSTDVHGSGPIAGQAITPHCGLICNATGGYFDAETRTLVDGAPPHASELEEYYLAKGELEKALLRS